MIIIICKNNRPSTIRTSFSIRIIVLITLSFINKASSFIMRMYLLPHYSYLSSLRDFNSCVKLVTRVQNNHIGPNYIPYSFFLSQSKSEDNRQRHERKSRYCDTIPSSLSSASSSSSDQRNKTSKKIAIVGGGLAGLSTAYHLLDKSANKNSTNTMYENEGQTLDITIFDKVAPGTGGASSVAGGLLHPFSPSGKLIYLGQEGLESSINLINIAKQYSSDPDKVILRDKLFRLAQTDTHVKQLLNTASDYPQYAKWQSAHDLKTTCGDISNCLGGLELRNGCKVIHVPSYLQGLWKACQARSSNNEIKCHLIGSNDLTKSSLLEFDTVVLSAGSGLFHDSILQSDDFPVQLVRGQSIEMSFDIDNHLHREALLCGKYVTPTTNDNEILIGSTHEYETKPWDQDKVLEELKSKTKYLPPYAWNGTINKVTMGYRVQSKRGKYGRLPMIGQLQYPELHHDLWLFTGLSSRGLIYHGIFGDILSDAILAESDSATESRYPNLVWWKKDNQSF